MRSRCQAPGCIKRAVDLHHVVYQQHLREGDPGDRRNMMALCRDCHFGHHGMRKLPLTSLPSSAFEFAVELLGAGAAYEYLKRRYTGADPRLEALLA